MLCAREGFRLCTMMLIEEIVESLCVQTPIIIQNVCVLLGDHRSLCMTGIALHGFDIAAVQFELVCNAGVSEAVENHFWEMSNSRIAFNSAIIEPCIKAGFGNTVSAAYLEPAEFVLLQ